MINLKSLRERSCGTAGVVLAGAEFTELIVELEVARSLLSLPLDGSTGWPMRAQQDMVAQLLRMLAADVSDGRDADLVAGVLVQEIAGMARTQVRSEKR